MDSKILDLFKHYDSLIWKVPSLALAIATGSVLAANAVGANSPGNTWNFEARHVQALVLMFGFLLNVVLTVAVLKYRIFEAWTVNELWPKGDLPSPPFGFGPRANTYIQGAMCLIAGLLGGLSLAQVTNRNWWIWLGLIFGILFWIAAEKANKRALDIYRARSSSSG